MSNWFVILGQITLSSETSSLWYVPVLMVDVSWKVPGKNWCLFRIAVLSTLGCYRRASAWSPEAESQLGSRGFVRKVVQPRQNFMPCCGSRSMGSVIYWPPVSSSKNSELRIRILSIYQRFGKMSGKVQYFIIIFNDLFLSAKYFCHWE